MKSAENQEIQVENIENPTHPSHHQEQNTEQTGVKTYQQRNVFSFKN